MPLKCVETIYCLPQVGKEIVHPVGKPSDKVHHKYHNRDRYGFGHPSEPSEGYRRSRDHNRRSHVRRSEELVPTGIAQDGTPGETYPESFSFFMG